MTSSADHEHEQHQRPGLRHGHHHDHQPADADRGAAADAAQDPAGDHADRGRRLPGHQHLVRRPRHRRRRAHPDAPTWSLDQGHELRQPPSPRPPTAGAAGGLLTFSVDTLAPAHSVMRATQKWTTATDRLRPRHPDAHHQSTDGTKTVGTISRSRAARTGDGTTPWTTPSPPSTASGLGLTASAIQTSAPATALQVTSTADRRGQGASSSSPTPTPPAAGFTRRRRQASDAQITLRERRRRPTPTTITSATNTFSDVLSGTSFTVSQAAATATVTVASDPDAIAAQGRRPWSTPPTPCSPRSRPTPTAAPAAPHRSRATSR